MGRPKAPLTEDEKQFIKDNHTVMSLHELHKTLKRNSKTVETFMNENNIPQITKSQEYSKRKRGIAKEGFFDMYEVGIKTWIV